MAGLQRFIAAQSGGVYETALDELRGGCKRSHWMWFVFPQIEGLGRSDTARFYAIADLAEACDYLADPLLAPRLLQITQAVSAWAGKRSATDLFGVVDAVKLRSSMTLFERAADDPRPFAAVLDGFFEGKRDPETLRRL